MISQTTKIQTEIYRIELSLLCIRSVAFKMCTYMIWYPNLEKKFQRRPDPKNTARRTVLFTFLLLSYPGWWRPPPPPCLSTCFSNRPGGVQKRQLIVMLQRYELCSRGSRYELCSRGSRYELCSRGSRFTHKSRILRQFTLEFLSIIGYLIFLAVSLENQVLGPKCTAHYVRCT